MGINRTGQIALAVGGAIIVVALAGYLVGSTAKPDAGTPAASNGAPASFNAADGSAIPSYTGPPVVNTNPTYPTSARPSDEAQKSAGASATLEGSVADVVNPIDDNGNEVSSPAQTPAAHSATALGNSADQ